MAFLISKNGIKKVKNDAELLNPNWSGWGCNRVSSGAEVTPKTALQLTAVACCVRILSETIAELPLHLYKYNEEGNRVRAYEQRLYYLLHDEPNPEMTSYQWREMMMAHLCVYGNAYSQIIRNKRGEVTALYPLKADRMTVMRSNDGTLYYIYDKDPATSEDGKGGQIRLPRDQVLHIAGLGFNGITGFSPISMARESIGSAISADQYAGSFFANGASPTGIIEYPKSINDPKKFIENFNAAYTGAKNAGKIPLLEDGMKFSPVSITQQDMQYLETRKFNIDEIARIYRIPPHMLADLEKSSFSNIEQQSLEFVKYTISPWVARWEQTLRKQLLLPEEKSKMFFAFNMEGLLRGDYATRMSGYATARQNGWMSANDIRRLENMNLIPAEEGGDLYLINGAMLPMGSAGASYSVTVNENKEGD